MFIQIFLDNLIITGISNVNTTIMLINEVNTSKSKNTKVMMNVAVAMATPKA